MYFLSTGCTSTGESVCEFVFTKILENKFRDYTSTEASLAPDTDRSDQKMSEANLYFGQPDSSPGLLLDFSCMFDFRGLF